jgi:hypothetical protein
MEVCWAISMGQVSDQLRAFLLWEMNRRVPIPEGRLVI